MGYRNFFQNWSSTNQTWKSNVESMNHVTHALHIRMHSDTSTREPFISAKEPFISAKEPFISANDSWIRETTHSYMTRHIHIEWIHALHMRMHSDTSAKEPFHSAKEPFISAKELLISAKSPLFPHKSSLFPQKSLVSTNTSVRQCTSFFHKKNRQNVTCRDFCHIFEGHLTSKQTPVVKMTTSPTAREPT